MKKFFSDLYSSFYDDIKSKKSIYIFSLLSIILGIVIGLILSFSYNDIDYVLNLSNKNYNDYLNGTAELSLLFVNNFKWIIIGNLICMLLSICLFTYFLGLIYIAYQSSVLVMTIFSVISNFKFSGILNSILFILPFNLVIIICLLLNLTLLYSFFRDNRKNKLSLFNIQNDKFIFFKLIIVLLIEALTCLILSFIVPIMLKSLIIVSF